MKVIPVTSGTLLATINERWSDSLIDNFILETDTGIVHVMLGHILYNFLLFTPQKINCHFTKQAAEAQGN